MSAYKGVISTAYFVHRELEEEPVTDPEEVRKYVKFIDYDRIDALKNGGEPIDCSMTYTDYQTKMNLEKPNKCDVFRTTSLLQKAVKIWSHNPEMDSWKDEGIPKIFARSGAILKLILPWLYIKNESPKDTVFQKVGDSFSLELSHTELQSDSIDNSVNPAFRVAEEMTVKENAYDNKQCEKPTLGSTCLYRVVKHDYGNFQLIVSKETDAVSKETDADFEAPVEIRGGLVYLPSNMDKILIKSVFLGDTKKFVFPVLNNLEDKQIVQYSIVEDASKLDVDGTVDRIRKLISNIFDFLIAFIKETGDSKLQLHPSPVGIIVNGETKIAIWNTDFKPPLKTFDNSCKPTILISPRIDMFPLNENSFNIKIGMNLEEDIGEGLVIVYALNKEELDQAKRDYADLYETHRPLCIIQYNKYASIQWNTFIEFLLSFTQDILSPNPLKKPVISLYPAYFEMPNKSDKIANHLTCRASPYKLKANDTNYIIAEELPGLKKNLSYYRRQPVRETESAKLKVYVVSKKDITKEIGDVLEMTFTTDYISSNASVEWIDSEKRRPEIKKEFGGSYKNEEFSRNLTEKTTVVCHVLHLAGKKAKINRKKTEPLFYQNPMNFDLQLISTFLFLENGFTAYRKTPNAIHVTGEDDEIQQVKEKMEKLRQNGNVICAEEKIVYYNV